MVMYTKKPQTPKEIDEYIDMMCKKHPIAEAFIRCEVGNFKSDDKYLHIR